MSTEDNGKKPEQQVKKTPEQFEAERLERYKKNPKLFVELSNVIHMTIRNPNSPLGISVFLGNAKRSEVGLSWSELNFAVQNSLAQMTMAAQMKKQAEKNVIHKAGNFLNGLRRMK